MPFAIFLTAQGLFIIVQLCYIMCPNVRIIAKIITDMKAHKKIRDHENLLKMIPETCEFKSGSI